MKHNRKTKRRAPFTLSAPGRFRKLSFCERLEDRTLLDGSGFQLRLEEAGFPTMTIQDNGPSDTDSSTGTISFASVTYGTFTISSTTVNSKPGLSGAQLDANTFDMSSSAGGTLTITWADTGFTPPGPAEAGLLSAIGGSVSGGTGSHVTFQSWANPDDLSPLDNATTTIPAGSATNGQLGPFTTPGYSGGGDTTFPLGSLPFSMFGQATISLVGKGSAGFNTQTTVDTLTTNAGPGVTLGSGSKLTDSATLSDGTTPTGTITFNLYGPGDNTYSNPLDTETVAVTGDGIYSTPNGYLPTSPGTYQWVASYSGDSNNPPVNSGDGNEPETVTKANSSVSTAIFDSSGGSVTDTLGEQVYDTASVTGSSATPTGTVTYYFYDTSSPVYGTTTPVSSQTVTLNANGSVPNSATSAALTAGGYAYIGVYSGDSNYKGATGAVEPLTINKGSSSVSTAIYDSTGGAVTSKLGEQVYDTATVGGTPFTPTGTVTYYFYNTASPIFGTTTPVSTQTVTLNANGSVPNSATSAALAAGGYAYIGVYSGDSNYKGSTGAVEPLTINQASPSITTTPGATTVTVGSGEYATIGFWHNKNGQAVINNFDSGPSSTLLGNALATNYKNLFGFANPYTSTALGKAPGVTPGLVGLTNAQVAAVYESLWTPSGLQKNTYVQAFAAAFGGYTTSGSATFNVGGNGAAFGVSNNSSISVAQVLTAATNNFNPTTGLFYGGDSTLTSELNNILNGINTSGENSGNSTVSATYLDDSATLSGGYNETGTLTFYLMGPGSTASTSLSLAVYTDAVTVSGNGVYSTPSNAYLPTATGTYEWVVVYTGDGNNTGVTSPFGSEPWMVGTQSPMITTTAGGAVVLGSGAALTDSAVLSNGANPTGAITFYLFAPGITPNATDGNNVYSDTVTISGNGTYSTSQGNNPGGYVPTVAGTYQWLAVYSGDSNNDSTASNFGDEPESTVASISISGTKFLDLTGNGFSNDDKGLGGVTINLYRDANNDGQLTSADGSPVATTTTASSGAYSFNNLAPGTYFVQESAPSGYLQTGGGPNGSAGNTYYTVTASSGHTYTGNNFDDAEMCDLSKISGVSFVINGCTTVTDLRGNTQQGETVTVTFTYSGSGPHDFSFVTYTAPGSSFDSNTAYLQQIYQDSTITVPGPGKYSLTVTIPKCYYQIDFVCGDAIDQLGPPGAGPDRSDIFYTPQHRLISADNGGTCATPSVNNGDFATIGFWHNRNGQALIDSLNGSSSSTALASWLVTNFPNLYGANAAVTSLTNGSSLYTNADIAAKYLTSAFFKASGTKTNAQILAAALAVYATDTQLAGGNYAAKYGFNTSLVGVGGDTYNVGSNGSAFGEVNNSKVSVFQLLQDVNAQANSNGTLSSSLFNAANSVFSHINQTGDITLLATGSELAVGGSQLVLSPAVLSSGQLWVALDGLDPTLGAAQEASIDAGIASLNAQLGKYGVTLVDVTANAAEADVADIDIHLADTTVIGGASQGVLGVTLFGGDVTLVNGWNWYYGADPTQIGATQFDFQTVATHELGHAIGLGHSTDQTSVMFPYLSAGEVRRTLSAADLSIIDAAENAAAEPLLAGGGPSVALEAAIGALFGADASPLATATSAGLALTSSNGAASAGAPSVWTGIASSANRRALFADMFGSDDESLVDDLADEASDAADGLYQAAVDVIHSFFG